VSLHFVRLTNHEDFGLQDDDRRRKYDLTNRERGAGSGGNAWSSTKEPRRLNPRKRAKGALFVKNASSPD